SRLVRSARPAVRGRCPHAPVHARRGRRARRRPARPHPVPPPPRPRPPPRVRCACAPRRPPGPYRLQARKVRQDVTPWPHGRPGRPVAAAGRPGARRRRWARVCDAGAVSTANNDPAVPPDPRPVCVLGLGLIGGSVLRALRRAGRDAHGYNRSAGPVAEARADGFQVTDDLTTALTRAAAEDALIVLAVPMPAVDPVLAAIAEHAPDC